MWLGFSWQRRERLSERSYRVPLSVANIPARTLIASPLPAGVDVRLRGPFTALRQLDPLKLEAVVDLSNATHGKKTYRLAPDDVNVPPEVEVIALSPDEIAISLEGAVEKSVPIVPEITGVPAAGARIAEVTVDPRSALIVGAESAVGRLTRVRTEPVSVAGRRSTLVTAAMVLAEAPDVRVREGAVATVTVQIVSERPALEPSPEKPRGKHK
jgi:hypothetical protein